MELLLQYDVEFDEDTPFGKDVEADHAYLMDAIDKVGGNLDKELISKAFYFCVEMHKGKYRKSGYPYYTHPLNVTLLLMNELQLHDSNSLAACLLHDTIEDVEIVSTEMITSEFDEDISEMVDGVTKISHSEIIKPEIYTEDNLPHNFSEDNMAGPIKPRVSKAETYRKLFMALVRDARVIMIKLADRLHNMRTLHYLSPKKQVEIAQETLNFYIPIAHRLGLLKVKMELENRSFYYSNRENYEAIRTALNEKRREFIDYIRVFSDLIQNSLNAQNLKHILSIVHKHEYEIHKMTQNGKSISDIDNFYSVVIILQSNDVHECYRALGVLANAFNTISFVDYIAKPKLDWYKSLNTELIGPDGKRIEILIRTKEMDTIAEEGFAANFSLKTGRVRALQFTDSDIDEWGEWMKDMIEEFGDNASQIIWDSLKVNLFDSELTVYSKEGRQISLPKGSTLVDYAFVLSDEYGLHCVTGKVNGSFHDLNYKLNSGDQVEIIKSDNAVPKFEWQKSVVSHRAVAMLHKYFKLNPPKTLLKKKADGNYDTKLIIRGEDRELMLLDITEAIGKSNIKRINLDTADSMFDGALSVMVENVEELNNIMVRLLTVKGVSDVSRVYEEEEK
ncbi:MAG: HD domain-containing protein [Candidatus Kapabacteria bacterium]|nr:HD domain-containing protein [Candidatus Kapabacteria bacterium]